MAVRSELVRLNDTTFWAFSVEYAEAAARPQDRTLGRVDYREVLNETEFKVFSRLRDWRKTQAEKEGVPIYTVFTNEQLSDMVRRGVQSHHTYACRRGRGQTAALAAAQRNCRRYAGYLKLDIRKYFDSVDHAILFRMLCGRFKDPGLLLLFERLLGTYQTQPGKGLPIGNLTSQYFANFYLNPLDRFVTETCRCGAYGRYMDDSVLWDDDRDRLRGWRAEIERFLEARLALRVKERTPVRPVRTGLTFLGVRVFPDRLRLDAHSKRRLAAKYRRYRDEYQEGLWSERDLQPRLTALFAFAQQADSYALRRSLIARFGDIAQ